MSTHVRPPPRGTRYSAKVGANTFYYTTQRCSKDRAKMLVVSYMNGPWFADGVTETEYPICNDAQNKYWWVDCKKVTDA